MRLWIIVLALAATLDIVTTMIGLHVGAREANPLMADVMSASGQLAAYLLKSIMTVAIGALVILASRRYRRSSMLMAAAACPICFVVVNNLVVIAGLAR